ncbi:MAG: C39 family peptidase, partial [Candidatus Thorarchaeota archaeon]|nr:C39 family peptidase [Candidatus Thorarchaeota archaeon]
LMTFLLLTPVIVKSNSDYTNIETSHITSAEAILPPVSYVWQEINGFCAWAATAMAMQYAGADVNLYDVFAASSIGFSFAYFHINDTILMFPGSLYTQAQPTHYLAGLYGIDYTLYVDASIPNLEQNVQVWENEGLTIGVNDGEAEAFDLMRETIDLGYPLLISVDPTWLPAADYDILREEGLSGGGHVILLVGYNDTEHTATYIDPGVGSFGDDFGYPEDGRGNYSIITYSALTNAWSNRFYISNTFIPNTDTPVIVDDSLGPLIRDKLLGVGAIYSPSSANAYVGNFGENAFRTMSTDMTVEGLKSYLSVFDGIANEVNFKASLILFIGLGLEVQVTLQYLSFRTSLEALPAIMSDTNLTDFVEAGEQALPHFEVLVDNSTLINPLNISKATGYVATTFKAIADSFNASGDIDAAFAPYEEDLDDISAALLGIADSWLDAGNALTTIWPNDFLSQNGPLLAFGIGGAIVVVILFIWWSSKKPSQ